MVGFMGNFLQARAAEILRPYLLSKKSDITFSAAVASIIMERLFDMVMLLLIFIWLLVGYILIIIIYYFYLHTNNSI